jgi:hypothetical protein
VHVNCSPGVLSPESALLCGSGSVLHLRTQLFTCGLETVVPPRRNKFVDKEQECQGSRAGICPSIQSVTCCSPGHFWTNVASSKYLVGQQWGQRGQDVLTLSSLLLVLGAEQTQSCMALMS